LIYFSLKQQLLPLILHFRFNCKNVLCNGHLILELFTVNIDHTNEQEYKCVIIIHPCPSFFIEMIHLLFKDVNRLKRSEALRDPVTQNSQ